MKQIKTISVKRHTSIECIPLTAMLVSRVSKLSAKLDNFLYPMCSYDEEGKRGELYPECAENDTKLILEASNLLNDIVNAFESDCEKEESE